MLHTATSITRAPFPRMISSSGSRYRDTASLIFCLASLIVRPCEIQPGSAGTVTTYQPSSPLVITTFRCMVFSRGLSYLFESRTDNLCCNHTLSPMRENRKGPRKNRADFSGSCVSVNDCPLIKNGIFCPYLLDRGGRSRLGVLRPGDLPGCRESPKRALP